MSGERTSSSDVANLLVQWRESNPPTDLGTFVTQGHLLVESHLNGAGVSEELLTQIELYCAAHFAMATNSDLQAKKTGDASESYARSAPKIGTSKYLAQAILLDPTGRIARAQDKQGVIRLLSI